MITNVSAIDFNTDDNSNEKINTERIILHCDMNNFYASVELLDYPQYRNLPVAICGDPKSRHGIILAKNNLAKEKNIQTAETIWQARSKCPELILLPPNHEKYALYSKKINEIYCQYTDLVEPYSIDESWLDVTSSPIFSNEDYKNKGMLIASEIQRRLNEELNLDASIGISFNKVFAKMGSEYKKPHGITQIDYDNFKKLVWPLPVNELFYAGRQTVSRLHDLNIYTIGELAKAQKSILQNALGRQGVFLQKCALGMDTSPVAYYYQDRDVKSIGHGETFSYNLTNEEEIETAIKRLSDRVCSRLRRKNIFAGGVKIDIKDPNFNLTSRQKILDNPTSSTPVLARESIYLLKSNWKQNAHGEFAPIRLISVTAINLLREGESIHEQLTFDFNAEEKDKIRNKHKKIDNIIDELRDKFGDDSIGLGVCGVHDKNKQNK